MAGIVVIRNAQITASGVDAVLTEVDRAVAGVAVAAVVIDLDTVVVDQRTVDSHRCRVEVDKIIADKRRALRNRDGAVVIRAVHEEVET